MIFSLWYWYFIIDILNWHWKKGLETIHSEIASKCYNYKKQLNNIELKAKF